MLLQQYPKRLIRTSVSSVSRTTNQRVEVARNVDAGPVREHIEGITKPNSLSGTVKKAGIALIAMPDPLTGVPGVALLASSYVLKRRDPANLGHIAQETRKLMRDIQSFTL